MRSVIKLLLLAFVVYAVFAAPPADRRAMQDGGRAFIASLLHACNGADGVCRRVADAIQGAVAIIFDSAGRSEGSMSRLDSHRPLDDTPRTQHRALN